MSASEEQHDQQPRADSPTVDEERPPGAGEVAEHEIVKMEDVITIDPETTEVDLNHGRIGKIENLEPLTKLERLYLRWNLIKKLKILTI